MAHLLFPTAFGPCGIAWGDAGITGFQLPDAGEAPTEARLAARDAGGGPCAQAPAWVAEAVRRVQQHLEGNLQDFCDLPIDWSRATEFQKAVFQRAQAIRPGFKAAYGDISRALALGPEGARAVGAALASNPWPLLVPCHRVVSADDRMTGFSAPGGVRTKTRLLVLEGAELLSE